MIEIYQRLIKEDLTPNSYYVLDCIKNKISIHKFVNSNLECSKLISNNWLTEDLQLTDKSIIFTTEIDGFFKKTKKKIHPKKKEERSLKIVFKLFSYIFKKIELKLKQYYNVTNHDGAQNQ